MPTFLQPLSAIAIIAVGDADPLPPIIPAQLPCGYEVVTIIPPPCGFLGPPTNTAYGVNNHGVVVGHFRDCNDPDIRHGWYWTEETGMVMLPPPPGYESVRPVDINDAGVIAGTFRNLDAGDRAFLYDHGEWTDLGTIEGYFHTQGVALNASAQVVGQASSPPKAFIHTHGATTPVPGLNEPYGSAGDINDAGVVTGWHGPSQTRTAYISDNGAVIDIGPVPNGVMSQGHAPYVLTAL